MKNTRFISAFLALIMLVSALSSCANPAGTSSSDANAQPSESPKEEITTEDFTEEKGNHIDLSVLTDDDLRKFEEGVVEKLKDDTTSEIKVNIFIKPTLSDAERDTKIEAQVLINEEKYAALNAVIKELEQRKRDIRASGEKTDEITSIDKQIEELTAESEKYQPGYGYAVNIVINEYCTPVLEEFIKKHKLPTDTIKVSVAMMLSFVTVTKEQLIQIVKDDSVMTIAIPSNISDIKHFGPEEIPNEITSCYSSNTPETYINTGKINEIYNIIDGETAINAGLGTKITNSHPIGGCFSYSQLFNKENARFP